MKERMTVNLIKPSVKVIEETNPFIKTEIVGRTCYKSSSQYTEESGRKFFKSLATRKHTAMLEHVTFVFQVGADVYQEEAGSKYLNYTSERSRLLISGNLRALNESKAMPLLRALYKIDPDLVYDSKLRNLFDSYIGMGYSFGEEGVQVVKLFDLKDLTKRELLKHFYMTFCFTCDRGVSHEIVRHRVASFAQESTRYCNYSKDKFDSTITFVEPAGYERWSEERKAKFLYSLHISEMCYIGMLNTGATPQQARAVLPNALKTEVVMTANAEGLQHFFDLRSRGTTGAPHPDMKVVADEALRLFRLEVGWDIL